MTTDLLTAAQISALQTAGREIAEGWLSLGAARDAAYDFSAQGDADHVYETALRSGIAAADLDGASDVGREMWRAVRAGYLSAPTGRAPSSRSATDSSGTGGRSRRR